jgi:hypothetical protein
MNGVWHLLISNVSDGGVIPPSLSIEANGTQNRLIWTAGSITGQTILSYDLYGMDAQTFQSEVNFSPQDVLVYGDLIALDSPTPILSTGGPGEPAAGLWYYDDPASNNLTAQYGYYVRAITAESGYNSNIAYASQVS